MMEPGANGSGRIVTCFVFSERDDELVVMIDESGKGAGLLITHTHTPFLPDSRRLILL
mgnify:CR=1 FL=1